MQFGFTSGCSPSMASLMVFSEGIAECKDHKIPTFIAALDACKAFDREGHSCLTVIFCDIGLTWGRWSLKHASCMNMLSKVKTSDRLSDPFYKVSARVGLPATQITKCTIMNFWIWLKNLVYVSISVMCMLLPQHVLMTIMLGTNSYLLQCWLNLVKWYVDTERYVTHPQKSVVVMYNVDDEWRFFTLGSEMMPIVDDYLHLGLSR